MPVQNFFGQRDITFIIYRTGKYKLFWDEYYCLRGFTDQISKDTFFGMNFNYANFIFFFNRSKPS